MNEKYLRMALDKIPDRISLIIVASQRAKQLVNNARPMVPVDTAKESYLDIALREIGEGLISFEFAKEEAEAPVDHTPALSL